MSPTLPKLKLRKNPSPQCPHCRMLTRREHAKAKREHAARLKAIKAR